MSLWFRVFAPTDTPPSPDALAAVLPLNTSIRFDTDPWFVAEITAGPGSPLILERFLTEEDNLRPELNSWAAYLETCDWSDNATPLMERTIQTRQLFTLRKPIDHPNESLLERLCQAVAQHLATITEGFYQADGQGFFAADGTILVQEY